MDNAVINRLQKKEFRVSPIERLSLNDILKSLGRKNDLFYVADSDEMKNRISVLHSYKTNDFSILYLDKGELTVKVNITTYTLKAGSIIAKSPEDIFQIQQFGKHCHFRIFGFTEQLIAQSGIHKKHLEALAFLSSRTGPYLFLNEKESIPIVQLLDLLGQKSKQKSRSTYYNESVEHAFAWFVFEIATLFEKEKRLNLTMLKRKEHLAINFLQLLSANDHEQRHIGFYARQLNVSPKHLSKCVKEVVGKTCGELIDEAVILEAKILLDNPELSVAQVSDQLHFSDQFFFSKYFKKHTGQSPSVYRASL